MQKKKRMNHKSTNLQLLISNTRNRRDARATTWNSKIQAPQTMLISSKERKTLSIRHAGKLKAEGISLGFHQFCKVKLQFMTCLEFRLSLLRSTLPKYIKIWNLCIQKWERTKIKINIWPHLLCSQRKINARTNQSILGKAQLKLIFHHEYFIIHLGRKRGWTKVRIILILEFQKSSWLSCQL